MRRPAGLTLYLALTRKARGAGIALPAPDRPARPTGPLIWLQVPDPAMLPAAAELLRRLGEDRPAAHLLLTAPDGGPVLPPRILRQPLPAPTTSALAAFLDHWRPDAAAQIGGPLDPLLLHHAAAEGLPVILVQPAVPPRRALRLIPGLARRALADAARILAPDAGTARILRRLGGTAAAIETVGRLEEGSAALACNEAERESVAHVLHVRPVWLAAALPEAEIAAVIEAHRAALRLAHRLLLIVVPDDPARGAAFAMALADAGDWRVALRSAEQEVDEETEVYVADTEGELGLWYRLAPITYLGGSLTATGCLRPPYEPAALGSAVVHGPRTGGHAGAFASLSEARAVREIRAAADLGEAVGDLLAPDRAALLAHNAWAVTSSGAEVTGRVAHLLLQALDTRRGPA
ncbi:MAG: 3-deoxy-D-manno-octulosonic acid transferase [Rhodobacteraceae bacterium]|nr:3-deoxy-D-manno-octulosonic acid transferase [Paracoccaceae bacterium]